jgi:ribonuclease P protein component
VLRAVKDSPYSFSRSFRLTSKEEFQAVFKKANKISQKHILGLYQPSQRSYSRLGIVVAKHIVNKAVARNRIKRLIRESFRYHKDTLKGLDIIVLLRTKYDAKDSNAWRNDIENLWQALAKLARTVSSV